MKMGRLPWLAGAPWHHEPSEGDAAERQKYRAGGNDRRATEQERHYRNQDPDAASEQKREPQRETQVTRARRFGGNEWESLFRFELPPGHSSSRSSGRLCNFNSSQFTPPGERPQIGPSKPIKRRTEAIAPTE